MCSVTIQSTFEDVINVLSKWSSLLGYGVFATKKFEKGQYLLTYKGPLLNAKDGEEKIADGQGGNFVYFFQHLGKDMWLIPQFHLLFEA